MIDEVRERRRELMVEFGGELERLFRALEARQAREPERLVDLRKRRTRPATR